MNTQPFNQTGQLIAPVSVKKLLDIQAAIEFGFILKRVHVTIRTYRHVSCDFKYKFDSTTCNSNLKWNIETCQCECKKYHICKKHYSWNPSTCTCQNGKYLKSIADTSVITCDEIISVMDIVSSKKKNTTTTNVSINCHTKKGRDCYILQRELLANVLL